MRWVTSAVYQPIAVARPEPLVAEQPVRIRRLAEHQHGDVDRMRGILDDGRVRLRPLLAVGGRVQLLAATVARDRQVDRAVARLVRAVHDRVVGADVRAGGVAEQPVRNRVAEDRDGGRSGGGGGASAAARGVGPAPGVAVATGARLVAASTVGRGPCPAGDGGYEQRDGDEQARRRTSLRSRTSDGSEPGSASSAPAARWRGRRRRRWRR